VTPPVARRLFSFRCRLCWRVTLAAFLGILLIEAAILVPSYRNYERDRLAAIAQTGRDVLHSMLVDLDITSLDAAMLARRSDGTALLGAQIHTPDGAAVASFGERPELLADNLRASRTGNRLDWRYSPEVLGAPYQARVRLDASDIRHDLRAFLVRILGLVLLIAAFVTIMTMAVLDRLVLAPMLRLHQHLQGVAAAPARALKWRLNSGRRDELGDVERAFDALLYRNTEALTALAQSQDELREQNALLDHRVSERTEALRQSNAALQAENDQRRKAEAQAESLARFPEENASPVLRVSVDGTILYANPASQPLLALWNTRCGQGLPRNWREFVAAVDESGQRKSAELSCRGRVLAAEFTPVPGTGYINIYAVDITERNRFEEALQRQAQLDSLTGLPNLSLLRDRIAQAIPQRASGQEMLAVMLVDLRDFQEVNAIAGHAGGDAVLRAAGERLAAALGPTDTVARLGGDVFTVLMTRCEDAGAAAGLADRLVEALAPPFHVAGQDLTSGGTVGIALYPLDGKTPEELLRNADLALYRAKQDSTRRYGFFVSGMNNVAEHRQRIVRGLERALAGEELELHLQPQVALDDHRIIGAEALVRWRHPEHGLIPPDEFIPVAESSRQIIDIGRVVLQLACEQVQRWREAGHDSLRVAVNLSVQQLEQPGIVDEVAEALRRARLPPSALELEVTESIMLRDVEHAIGVLQALADLGVLLSLDDFGTGHSSMAYLQRLPLHKLKIDKAFVAPLTHHGQSEAICTAIIRLGHGLGLTVIAEGVEEPAQLETLRRLGCDEGQGYLFGRPEPAAAFLRRLGTRSIY
jgi:diguanylate cyclase (GGDEF)-like protein